MHFTLHNYSKHHLSKIYTICLLVIGLFLFTVGYVNQNKYNCNIIPSLEKEQEQNLRELFYNNNVFFNRRNNNLLYTYNESGNRVLANETIGERNTGSIPAIPATPYTPPNNNNR